MNSSFQNVSSINYIMGSSPSTPVVPLPLAEAESLSAHEIQEKTVRNYLSKLGSGYDSWFFLSVEQFCEMVLIDHFVIVINLSTKKEGNSLLRAFQTFAKILQKKKWKEANSPLISFFSETLPAFLALSQNDMNAFLPSIRLINGLGKLSQIHSREVQTFLPSTEKRPEQGQDGMRKMIVLQQQLHQFLMKILEPFQKKIILTMKELSEEIKMNQRLRLRQCLDDDQTDINIKSCLNTARSLRQVFFLTNQRNHKLKKIEDILLRTDAHSSLTVEWMNFLVGQTLQASQEVLKKTDDCLALLANDEDLYCFLFLTDKRTPTSEIYVKQQFLNLFQGLESFFTNLGYFFIELLNEWKKASNSEKVKFDPHQMPNFFDFLKELFRFELEVLAHKQKKEDLSEIKKRWSEKSPAWFSLIVDKTIEHFNSFWEPIVHHQVEQYKKMGAHFSSLKVKDSSLFLAKKVDFFCELLARMKPYSEYFGEEHQWTNPLKENIGKILGIPFSDGDALCIYLTYLAIISTKFERIQRQITDEPKNYDQFVKEEVHRRLEGKSFEKKLAIQAYLKEIKESRQTIVSLQHCLSLVFLSFIAPLEKGCGLLSKTDEEANEDVRSLLIQCMEEEERFASTKKKKKEKSPSKLYPKAAESSVPYETDDSLNSLQSNMHFSETKEVYPFFSAMNRLILPRSFTSMSQVTRLQESEWKKIFSFDLAYHVECMQKSWEMIERLGRSGNFNAILSLASAFLNSYYYAHEQAITPKSYEASSDANLSHGLMRLYQSVNMQSEELQGLDKMTIWYRYPHFSSEFYLKRNKQIPSGLQLLISEENSNFFSSLTKIILPALPHLFTQANEHLSAQQSKVQAPLASLMADFVCQLQILLEEPLAETAGHSQLNAEIKSPLTSAKQRLQETSAEFLRSFNELESNPLAASTVKDLRVHLQRLIAALELIEQFPEQKFLGIHTHLILMAGQYIAELACTLYSLQKGSELRTHQLQDYLELFNLQEFLSKETLQFMEEYLFMGKGCDYPFWTFYKGQGAVKQGMKLLNESFWISREAEGFLPKGAKCSKEDIQAELMNVVEGIMNFFTEWSAVAAVPTFT